MANRLSLDTVLMKNNIIKLSHIITDISDIETRISNTYWRTGSVQIWEVIQKGDIEKTISKLKKIQSAISNTANEFENIVSSISNGGIQLNGLDSLSLLKSEIVASFDKNSLYELSIGDGKNTTSLTFFGFLINDNSFEGQIFKLSGESKDQIFGIDAKTKAEIKIGAVRGEASGSIDYLEFKDSSESKEGLKYNSGDVNEESDGFTDFTGETKGKSTTNIINAGVKAETGFTAAEISYGTQFGEEESGLNVGADVKLIDADIGARAGVQYDSANGLSAVVKGEAGLSLAEVEGKIKTSIAGIETKTSVSAEVGFGVYGEFGYTKEDGLTVGFGGSFIVGGKIKFNIKLPKLW